MNPLLKINVEFNIIGMVKLVIIININVLMVPTGKDLCVSPQVHANKVIIKIKVDIVRLSHRHVYLQQHGMVKNVKLMEHVLQVLTIVEAAVKIMFHVRMVMYGIVSISLVIVPQENNQMVIHVCSVQVENIGLLGLVVDVQMVILILVRNARVLIKRDVYQFLKLNGNKINVYVIKDLRR